MNGSLHKIKGAKKWRYQWTDQSGRVRTRTLTRDRTESQKLARAIECNMGGVEAVMPEVLKGIPAIRRHEMSGKCVYFLCREGRVVYVGTTLELGKRVCEHLTNGQMFDSVYWVPVSREMNALTVERHYQRLFQPEQNGPRTKR